ncbi:MAG: enoyl-CoA hydratase-related protein [Myxococcaceae bacterium]|jgi:enoyl-CoA hydratase|nr:enoyl-CoA hydratase-related protein [Myxococcaceae bacterium]
MATWQVTFEHDVAIVSLDDGKANAVLVPEFQSLEAALDEVAASRALAVVLTGRPGYLSAGLNVKALPALSLDDKRDVVRAMASAVLKLFLFPRPVVAAVSGHALGAGAMLALAADLRVFADGPFKFGLNEVPTGLFVPSFAIELARAAVSSSRLTELVVHGRVLSPHEALSMHVAEVVHAPESLMAAALMHARHLSGLAGGGYALTKRLVRGPGAAAARAALPAELDELAQLLGGPR